MKAFVLKIILALIAAANAILTSFRPVTMSSQMFHLAGSFAVDNIFDNLAHTNGPEVPWVNI